MRGASRGSGRARSDARAARSALDELPGRRGHLVRACHWSGTFPREAESRPSWRAGRSRRRRLRAAAALIPRAAELREETSRAVARPRSETAPESHRRSMSLATAASVEWRRRRRRARRHRSRKRLRARAPAGARRGQCADTSAGWRSAGGSTSRGAAVRGIALSAEGTGDCGRRTRRTLQCRRRPQARPSATRPLRRQRRAASYAES